MTCIAYSLQPLTCDGRKLTIQYVAMNFQVLSMDLKKNCFIKKAFKFLVHVEIYFTKNF